MSAWMVLAVLAANTCALSTIWSRRRAPLAPVTYPVLSPGRARAARGLLASAGGVAVTGIVWALVALDQGSSPLPGLGVILIGCAVRRVVLLWRESQARMIWSAVAEDSVRELHPPRAQ